ncbi:vitamin B12 import system permease BtuC [Yersinia pestis]|uniref:Vitamin B12 import system permease protein BtuC n=22 Tax=Yersinia pseudotuberculosis complex TaxID=1649845 RepID=BTUC_YERPE|nr:MULTISPECIES: vitamin B12 ABC transporter permease BtuC [Yersinia pseudotuberculosis complex]A7FHG9.1 RecName: Full=Vitamin B12 import system permease protein BtuC [Yersinia pseudotuberculosis IP 31758]A9R099.1 RecName: Full=Vitamin B12 import system permease protein BtuC [Yersinia pestis Angola]B1JJ25.1 RecName: Full=Vitamin B12 import system permease protein BtuC [Yersinia pseudotuberculosis YPIII]B2K660.1 RecName: Full=Vitamin B12 import system permease protein BtuC [Yersinia pseudotuberc
MQTSQLFTALQQRQRQRDYRYLTGLVVMLLFALLISLCAGDVWIWPEHWFSESGKLFVWQLRLPRSMAVIMVGASLAVSGAVMQALFENPLAEPGLLGVANGAGVALVTAVLLGHGLLPIWVLSTCAIIGALLMTSILLSFTRRRLLTNAQLLLVGVALGIICSAMMTWAVYFSTSLDLRQLMYWMMGGFSGVDWRQQSLVLALLPTVIWLCCQGRVLNFMSLGEQQARQLGVSLHLWRNLLVLAIGLLVGISVALAGVISFIGLVIPHILRLTGLTDQRRLLAGCAFAGGGVLLLADVVARTVLSSAELPIGVVTATLGSPLFIWLLIRVKGVK